MTTVGSKMPSNDRAVLLGLVGLTAALLLVGVASGTVVRHVVQVLPAVAAGALLVRRPPLGATAAIPIFAFWTFIPVMIWLFLLGLSRIATGNYTLAEILLTVVMVVCSMVGIVKSLPLSRLLALGPRALTLVVFAILQVAAMWLSFSRSIVRD